MPKCDFNKVALQLSPGGFLMFSGGIEREQWHEMG